jgi:predicted pyridoxine 5'-phosphate oxidase superfamily flavin-nucleotide-binding protein
MATLAEPASKAWEDRQGPVVFTTVDEKGVPNSIYVTCVQKIGDDQIVVADNKFDKTRANIMPGSKASLLYITKEKKAYQIKGSLEYLTEGEIYEEMKNGWLDKKYPGNAATLIHIEEIYSGAERLA